MSEVDLFAERDKKNTSKAVKQSRNTSLEGNDYFPTPPWATRALMEHVIIPHLDWGKFQYDRSMNVYDPACGGGHMIEPLLEYFDGGAGATDVVDYGYYGMDGIRNFVPVPLASRGWKPTEVPEGEKFDWIICNPPFKLALDFTLQALSEAKFGVAMLCRSAFLETAKRHEYLFVPHPPAIAAQFVMRVKMREGSLTTGKGSQVAYSWFVWNPNNKEGDRTDTTWIPNCEKELTLGGDYEQPNVVKRPIAEWEKTS